MKRALSETEVNSSGLHYRIYGSALNAETDYIAADLTFLHTSFTKKFCQKKVKKNRKSVAQVSFENTAIRRGKRCGDILSDEPEACTAAVTRIYRSR